MIATYQRTIFEKGDFSICAFKPENEQEPPQSAVSKYGTFVGTGFNLPHSEDISLNLDGTWESSKIRFTAQNKHLYIHPAENGRRNNSFSFVRRFALHQEKDGSQIVSNLWK